MLQELRSAFKEIPVEQHATLIGEMHVENPEGHTLSPHNHAFLAWQGGVNFTVVAGFEQWKNFGRHVKKGAKASWIFVPSVQKAKPDPEASDAEPEETTRFLLAPVFDISQTFEIREAPDKKVNEAFQEGYGTVNGCVDDHVPNPDLPF